MLLLILYIALPYAFLSHGIIHIGQRYGFLIASGILFGEMLYKGFPNIKNKYIGLFFVYLSLLVLGMCFLNMMELKHFMTVSKSIVTLLYFMSAITVYMATFSSKLKKETFYNVVCIAALMQVILVTFQYYGYHPDIYILSKFQELRDTNKGGIVSGTLGNSNFVMAYISISTPFFFRKNWAYCLFLIVPLILASKVFFASASLAVGTMFYFGKNIRFVLTGATFVLLYALIFDREKIFHGERVEMWTKCIKEFKTLSSIMIGFGPFNDWNDKRLMHNEYLVALHRFGVIGFIIIIGYLKDKIDHFNFFGILTGDKILYTAMVVALANCIGNPALHIAPILFLIIIIFGLIERDQLWQTT